MIDSSGKHSRNPRQSSDSADRALLTRIANGDREALRELYLGYHQRLLRFLYRMTGQLEAAREGVNDVMLVVWERSESFNGRSLVSTWIMGIAYRKGLKIIEKSRRWTDRFVAVDYQDWNEPSAPSAEFTDAAMTKDLLAQALRQLPPHQRTVVELTYFYGHSYQEISEIMGCPVNTVKTRMFHARAKLNRLLRELGDY